MGTLDGSRVSATVLEDVAYCDWLWCASYNHKRIGAAAKNACKLWVRKISAWTEGAKIIH